MAEVSIYKSNTRRSTRYCTVEGEGGFEIDEWKAVIQKIYVHEADVHKLRFGYYDEERFIARPLEIREEDLPLLLKGVLEAGILEDTTIKKIKDVLMGHDRDKGTKTAPGFTMDI